MGVRRRKRVAPAAEAIARGLDSDLRIFLLRLLGFCGEGREGERLHCMLVARGATEEEERAGTVVEDNLRRENVDVGRRWVGAAKEDMVLLATAFFWEVERISNTVVEEENFFNLGGWGLCWLERGLRNGANPRRVKGLGNSEPWCTFWFWNPVSGFLRVPHWLGATVTM